MLYCHPSEELQNQAAEVLAGVKTTWQKTDKTNPLPQASRSFYAN
jgi:hypothetical protein